MYTAVERIRLEPVRQPPHDALRTHQLPPVLVLQAPLYEIQYLIREILLQERQRLLLGQSSVQLGDTFLLRLDWRQILAGSPVVMYQVLGSLALLDEGIERQFVYPLGLSWVVERMQVGSALFEVFVELLHQVFVRKGDVVLVVVWVPSQRQFLL